MFYMQLAKLHYAEGNYEKSLENLEEARKIASREKYHNELKRIVCLIGISKGSATFDTDVVAIVEKDLGQ